MAEQKFDWDYWQHKYITGSDAVTLEFLSGLPNAPKLSTLKKHSHLGLWRDHRKNFRNQVGTQINQNTTAQHVFAQTQQLVDTAKIITEHLMIARGARAIISRRLKEILNDPEEISKLSFRDLGPLLKTVTDIERLAMGLATEYRQVDVNANIDLSSLTDEQLQRLALGESPEFLMN